MTDTRTLLSVLHEFPEESKLVGDILVSYGELEFGLLICVQEVMNDDNAAIKALFRTRGEGQRIGVADGLARIHYAKLGLETRFSMTIGAMKGCKDIRNNLSHCVFHRSANPSGALTYINLEDVAKVDTDANTALVPEYPIDAELLKTQLEYFKYTDDCLYWCTLEASIKLGRTDRKTEKPFPWPKQLNAPPLHKPRS